MKFYGTILIFFFLFFTTIKLSERTNVEGWVGGGVGGAFAVWSHRDKKYTSNKGPIRWNFQEGEATSSLRCGRNTRPHMFCLCEVLFLSLLLGTPVLPTRAYVGANASAHASPKGQ